MKSVTTEWRDGYQYFRCEFKLDDPANPLRGYGVVLAAKNWSTGLGSFHDWQNIFNMDISGAFPFVVANALVHGEGGYVHIFSAMPEEWRRYGEVKGLTLRDGLKVDSLSWDANGWKVRIARRRSGR